MSYWNIRDFQSLILKKKNEKRKKFKSKNKFFEKTKEHEFILLNSNLLIVSKPDKSILDIDVILH